MKDLQCVRQDWWDLFFQADRQGPQSAVDLFDELSRLVDRIQFMQSANSFHFILAISSDDLFRFDFREYFASKNVTCFGGR
jgi:hypothetical protein